MTWRGSTTQQDRILACLVYLIPMLEALPLGGFLMFNFPILQTLLFPLLLLSPIYRFSVGGLQIVAMALFIGLYVGVVRSEKFRHFIRFNTMQALLLAIVVYLFELVLNLLGIIRPLSPVSSGSASISPLLILLNTLFLGIFAASIYSIFRSARGLYAEMPIVSEAAYLQTR